MSLRVSAAFDSGNIELLSQHGDSLELAIRADAHCEHRQWYFFRVAGGRGRDLCLRITNAGQASFPEAWPGCHAVVSHDRRRWLRARTDYQQGVLEIRHRPEHDLLWVAAFAPYTLAQHQGLLAWCAQRAEVQVLGTTLDGRDLDMIKVGTGPTPVWVLARQHPGESMAAWWAEGFLRRLLSASDPLSRKLRATASFYLVPNMNPDGVFRGHLRTNAAGANLNRCWHQPSPLSGPEVLAVRQAMDRTGVALALDVHGEEALRYAFIQGSHGVVGWDAARQARLERFKSVYAQVSPDFQTEHGYRPNAPGTANLSLATNQLAARFGALAMTLEQPFEDAANHPEPVYGWSPERSQALGAAALHPLWALLR